MILAVRMTHSPIYIGPSENFRKHLIPRKKPARRKTPRQEWITPGLIKCCNTKSKLYKNFKVNPSLLTELTYKKYRNKLKSVLKTAEREYYTNKLQFFSSDLKQYWTVLNGLLKGSAQENIALNFNSNGAHTSDPLVIVNKFNEYFSNIGQDLASKISATTDTFTSFLKGSFSNSFSLFPTTASEIINVCNNLPNKASMGLDEIPTNIMKKSIYCVADTLAHIINKSFKRGEFPDKLKIAKICPVYKGGVRNEFSNYRPISILPSFSKIFEKVVHIRLHNYLFKHSIISDAQYGFRSKHSTYMALVDLYDKVSKFIDERQVTLGVFVDLQKAFDTVNFNILLKKLEHYGIRGSPLKWFESYLTNRFQSVSLNDVLSSPRRITCGVPQGSILGPLLFVIYINDIVNSSQYIHFILYTDDTTLLFHAENFDKLIAKVNQELMNLSIWFRANMLSLNVSKTNFIVFGSRLTDCSRFNNSVYFDKSLITQVDVTKFLGVYIDRKLTWKHHISQLCITLSRKIGIMYKLCPTLPDKAVFSLYFTLILPHLM